MCISHQNILLLQLPYLYFFSNSTLKKPSKLYHIDTSTLLKTIKEAVLSCHVGGIEDLIELNFKEKLLQNRIEFLLKKIM